MDNGLFDKYTLIDSCITTLGTMRIEVKDIGTQGVQITDVIKRLSALKQGLRNEEQVNQGVATSERNGD